MSTPRTASSPFSDRFNTYLSRSSLSFARSSVSPSDTDRFDGVELEEDDDEERGSDGHSYGRGGDQDDVQEQDYSRASDTEGLEMDLLASTPRHPRSTTTTLRAQEPPIPRLDQLNIRSSAGLTTPALTSAGLRSARWRASAGVGPSGWPGSSLRSPRSGGIDEEEDALLDEEEESDLEAMGGRNAKSTRDLRPISLTWRDRRAMVLLLILYIIQGVPRGLVLSCLPILLQPHTTYSHQATFALSQYPYSLKLLWSPLVDAFWWRSFGRRKSWIVPLHMLNGAILMGVGAIVQGLLDNPTDNIYLLTACFTALTLVASTLDIAVDGWTITSLAPEKLAYASTCQTVGMTVGFFASFTVFLALNTEETAASWGLPRLMMGSYLQFWACWSFVIVLWLVLVEKERNQSSAEDVHVKGVYGSIWAIFKLSNIHALLGVHVFCKIGWAANEATTQLKFVERGLSPAQLSLINLVDFPIQVAGGWLAARWATGPKPLRAWMAAFWFKFGVVLASMVLVWTFPAAKPGWVFLTVVVVHNTISSFCGTVQYVGISTFHARIADPVIGGTYMTLLATMPMLAGTWPRYFVLKGVDFFTVTTCQITEPQTGSKISLIAAECSSDIGKASCAAMQGTCITEVDGYYWTSALCLFIGVVMLVVVILPVATRLQALPAKAWRVPQRKR